MPVYCRLGRVGDTRAVEPLIAALNDENEHEHLGLRQEEGKTCLYAAVLGMLGDTRAVEPLIAALENENDRVCGYAAEALGKLGDARAVEPLIAALKNREHYYDSLIFFPYHYKRGYAMVRIHRRCTRKPRCPS